MSASASPVRIGAFVVGAIALVLVGLIAFGSGQFFTEKRRFVAYFDGNVTGLRVGAPVMLRGVPIGEVTAVRARYDPSDMSVEVPVYFEAVRGSVEVADGLAGRDIEEEYRKLIESGFRARLAPLSFVTGQLYIDLGAHPGTPTNLRNEDPDVIEIPTIPSQFEVLESRIASFFGSEDTREGVKGLAESLNRLLGDENQQALARALQGVADFASALGQARKDVGPVLDNVRGASERTDQVMADLDGLVDDARDAVGSIKDLTDEIRGREGKVDEIADSLQATLLSVGRMADQINNAVAENRPGINDFTEDTLYAIDGVVLDLEQLAATLNRVADELERDPSRFIFGNRGPQGIQTP